ncbi:4Fe-4S binding protein [Olsenella profusa]|uniref:4Fe-4S binding domain protein n=1 Tax=Olsenella profusa F0195 TaxID=1125712 RepID=U2V0K2_9ACTN|nr:4Fe-4S binding protein [Olsenella profusa]ERL06211.1 4Fe-4S binding domain protein [Olsenella profusa F0195]
MKTWHETHAAKILRRDAAWEYTVSDDCILCGTCARVCPANNIVVGDTVEFSDHCEVCYACLHNCP